MAEPTKSTEPIIDHEKALAKLKAFYEKQMTFSGKVNHNPYTALEKYQYARLQLKAEAKALTSTDYASVLALDEAFIPTLANLGV